MKDVARAVVSRLALLGLALVILGLLPLYKIIGSCEQLQAASMAGGLVLIVFALGRENCRS